MNKVLTSPYLFLYQKKEKKIRVETRAESSWWLLCVLTKVLLVPNPKFTQAGLGNKKELFLTNNKRERERDAEKLKGGVVTHH